MLRVSSAILAIIGVLACLVPARVAVAAGDLQPIVHTQEADVNLPTMNVIWDAPWRVQVRPGRVTYIPVMVFFPETKAFWRRAKVLSIRIAALDGNAETLLYEDTSTGAPVFGTSLATGLTGVGMRVVDGFGRVTADADIVKDQIDPADPNAPWSVAVVDDDLRGWHTILLMPVPPSAMRSDLEHFTLVGSVAYRRLGADDDAVYTIRRRLDVEVDKQPLPTFAGWIPYDTHVHSLAEFSADLSYKAIRKAYGGPLQMIKECAYAIGLTSDPQTLKDRVIITDHNTFFSDREWVRYGPTTVGIVPGATQVLHPELSPYFVDLSGHPIPEGQREFENYQDLVGITMGEEVTLAKPGGIAGYVAGTLGSHLLTYSTRHFMGPFHGGRFFVFRDEPNPNTVDKVLSDIAADPHFPGGFCYAAHPFSGSWIYRDFLDAWTDDQIDTAIRGEHVRTRADGYKEFVFKGFELWNEHWTRYVERSILDPEVIAKLLEDPTNDPSWRQGDPNWDERLQIGLARYHQAIADRFTIALAERPDARFVRKFYMAAGSDAHGDFNRNSNVLGRGLVALPAQVLRFLKAFSITDSAFGKVRTLVEPDAGNATTGSRALEGLAEGHSIITDGPVIQFQMDACGHFDARTGQFTAQSRFTDTDGLMGGTGSMDGGRTMLVADGGHDVLMRYRHKNTSTFGGAIDRIEVYRDEAGGHSSLVSVARGGTQAKVLQPDGHLDPGAAPGDDGWCVVSLDKTIDPAFQTRELPLPATQPGSSLAVPPPAQDHQVGPVRTMSAFALGAFTARLPVPPFDHRAYTNPIWVVPVKLDVLSTGAPGAVAAAGAVSATFKFPITMSPQPVECSLVPLDATGASAGKELPLDPAAGAETVLGWSKNTRENIADSIYTVANYREPVPLTGAGAPAGWGLKLAAPRDMYGNTLNAVGWRFKVEGNQLVRVP